ncbi:nucleolar complex protein 3 homolog isoform X2 [Halichondria panicea]
MKVDSERPSQRKRARNVVESEAEFETHPRASDWTEGENDVHYFLPLKAEHGRLIHQPPLVTEHSVNEEQCDQSEPEVDEAGTQELVNERPVDSTPVTVAELFARRHEKLAEKRVKIAELASGLVEDPETNISYLKSLRDLCTERDPDVAITVRKLAIVSLTTLFKDIAPSYHIRELTDAEQAVKVKKEVRKLRGFEEGLLTNYQAFLSLLDDTVKLALKEGGESQQKKRRRERNKPLDELDGGLTLSREAVESVGEVSLQSLCQLLLSLSHFNFRNNLLVALVPRMASKDKKVSQLCCETMEKLLKSDQNGDISLEAVQMISKMVKAKSYKTKTAVLDTLLYLQLSAVDEPVSAGGPAMAKKPEKKKEMKLSKKQRKHLKEEKMLNRDLQETNAIESRDKRAKMQTEILRVVFTMYFRILKHSRHSPLLRPVLRGLAKFAHLISVDFFSDLMSVLHSLAESGGLSNRECMQCVSTAFEILSGQGSSLNIDPRQFYVQLYGALLQLDTRSTNEDLLLAVECMDKLIRKRRQISLQRVFAFVKRLSTISLQLLPGACLAVMTTIRTFIQSYQQTERLLDVESVGGGGVFRPDIPDPEMCHASSTLLWELTLLKHHYNGAVRSYSTHLLAGAPSQGKGALNATQSRKSPAQAMGEFPSNPSISASGSESLMMGAPPPLPHPWDKVGKEHYYTDKGLSPHMLDCELRAINYSEQQQCTTR